MRRVVLDTNVIVSSMRGGKPRVIFDLWRHGHLVLCVSEEIVAEYLEVVAGFPESADQARRLTAVLNEPGRALHVEPAELRVVADDPDDDAFVACAVAAEADVIISGDRHLLDLGSFRGIPIPSPAEFLDAWCEGDSQ